MSNEKSNIQLFTIATLIGCLLMVSEVVSSSEISAEEVIVLGKFRSAADDVKIERIESDVVADIIDAETIGRVGDSTVASSLRRMPGVTLLDGKYVFIRGLGERYSNSLLNGAVIPSPDLTRNVIPLDIFPTSILDSIAVKKSYSAEMPAAFSGGLIDIRTSSIPDELTFSFEIGSKYLPDSNGKVLTYSGGEDDSLGSDDGTRELSTGLKDAINTYSGSLDSIDILDRINLGDGSRSLADAEAINRSLALMLNRNIDIKEQSEDIGRNLKVSLGNNFYLDNGVELGFSLGTAYSSGWSSGEYTDRSFGDPEEIFSNTKHSDYNVDITGNSNFGVRWNDDHRIEATSLLLRNTTDRSAITDKFTSSTPLSDGIGSRNYRTRFEERNMTVNQLHGIHRFADQFNLLNELNLNWFYSDSTSKTDIPNQTNVAYATSVDSLANPVSQNLQVSSSAADFRFTNLNDQVQSWGYDIDLPLDLKSSKITLSGGYRYSNKSRIYKQLQFGLGTDSSAIANNATGSVSEIFSDEQILDPSNEYGLTLVGSNGESYLAALANSSVYGKFDMLYDETWRVILGLRWEDYSQFGAPWNPLKYDGCQISCDNNKLFDSVFKGNDLYPSVAVTYINPGFLADDYQLRFAYSETVVRPDLREITPSSYIDPITSAIVSGNSSVIPSTVKNFDIRSEWFFSSGDTFTVSFFHKEISNPIEFFEAAAFEESLAMEIINSDSSSVTGLEIEWLKGLESLGQDYEQFFVAGNLTALDSELIAGENADAPTNPIRSMSGASDYAVNLQLGYDSNDGKHSSMLIYNVFGERLYYAGRNGSPDAYEQPFNSLDMTYSFYPTDNFTVKLKLKNILDEKIEIAKENVTIHEEEPGTTLDFGFKWSF